MVNRRIDPRTAAALMQTAHVIASDLVEHPNSGKERNRIETTAPWTMAGCEYPSTYVWADTSCPELSNGESVSWDGHHVYARGLTFRKAEYDSSGAPVR